MSTTRKVEAFLDYANDQAARKKRTNESYIQSHFELDFSNENVTDEEVEKLIPSFNSLVSPVSKVILSGHQLSNKGMQGLRLWVLAQSPMKTEVQCGDTVLTNVSTKRCAIL